MTQKKNQKMRALEMSIKKIERVKLWKRKKRLSMRVNLSIVIRKRSDLVVFFRISL